MDSIKQAEGLAVEVGREGLAQDEASGAKVYSFDPDPAEKASAALRAAQDKLAPMNHVPGTGARLLQGLANAAPTPFNIPSITIEDSDEKKPVEEPKALSEEKKQPAEQLPEAAKPSIHDFCTAGWRRMLEKDMPPLAEGEEKDNATLTQFLSEQFYGDWWRNAGVIVFAVVSTRFLTWLGFGIGGVFIVLTICYTHYRMTVQRFERDARDDILREMARGQLGENHPERVQWINRFLNRFWQIYEPILSATIRASADQILNVSTPGFLDSLRLSEFSLGNKAPKIDKIWTMVQEDDDVVQWEWSISFTPTDTIDMTERQIKKKLNPKIVLLVRVGKGLATASLPILVEDVSLTGRIRIRLKLTDAMPYVQIVDFCFMEPPVIKYALKPLGGDTFGLDIASLPGLSPFIRETTHFVLGPMMYYPNMYRLNLEQMLSGQPLETAVGVLELMVHSARGIKGGSLADSTPDPYVSLAVGTQAEAARTKFRDNTHNPTWMEVKYILINKLESPLHLHVYDHNARRKHQRLCTATFDLSLLKDDAVQEGIVTQLREGNKECGELRYDLNYYPVLDPEVDTKDLAEANAEDSTVGVVRLVIHQAKELDTSASISGDINPLAKLFLNNGPKADFSTATYKRTKDPVWEAPYEFLCSSKEKDIVTIKVINDRDFRKNPTIGYMSIRLKDLLDCKAQGRDWFQLNKCKSGKIRVSATWKPVAMSGSLHGAGQYVPPIGAVKIWIQKAENVKNVDSFGSKSDPYVRVQVRNETKGKTKVIDNDLNPLWDEIVYVPVHSLRESIMLDCLDYERVRADRPLGSVELHVSDLAKKTGDEKFPYEGTGTKTAADTLRLNKGDTKGILHYQATFVPAWQTHVHFSKHGTTPAESGQAGDEDGGYVSDSSVSSVTSNESNSDVPLTFKPKRDSTGSIFSPTVVSPVDTLKSAVVPKAHGHHYSKEELLAQQSGIVVFNVVSGKLSEKGRIEVVLDDLEWPSVSTPKARSKTAKWEFVGEGFVKEIDFSQVNLFLDEAEEEGEDRVVSQWSGPIKEFLRDTLHGPKEYTLTDKNGKRPSTVMIEARYIPVPVVLEPRESVNNQGTLRVELVDGQDMRAVDRGGTRSDPYAAFTLNGEKVFKSETHKKTVTPEWNENFEVNIPSRAHAEFNIEVFDWDRVGTDESLGVGSIDLRTLEAFQLSERWIPLSTPKHGEKGRVRVRLLFQPMIIAKTRKTASTFTSAGGRAMTTLGALPVNAGKGVAQGVTGLFRRD